MYVKTETISFFLDYISSHSTNTFREAESPHVIHLLSQLYILKQIVRSLKYKLMKHLPILLKVEKMNWLASI